MIELKDNIFGFDGGVRDEVDFLDIELSKMYSRHIQDSSSEVFSMIIEVSNKGTLYEREVWNFEQACGWIGGLIGFIYVLIN